MTGLAGKEKLLTTEMAGKKTYAAHLNRIIGIKSEHCEIQFSFHMNVECINIAVICFCV
jgi:hypothetical protein